MYEGIVPLLDRVGQRVARTRWIYMGNEREKGQGLPRSFQLERLNKVEKMDNWSPEERSDLGNVSLNMVSKSIGQDAGSSLKCYKDRGKGIIS